MPNPFDRSKMRDRMTKVRGHEKGRESRRVSGRVSGRELNEVNLSIE
jgi:hypothetical protein